MKTKLLSLLSVLLIVTLVLPAFQSNTAYAQGDGESIPLIVTEVEGYVQYIGADYIVVDGFVIHPNGSFDLSTLTIDDYVFIVGTLNEDATVQAISLEYVDVPEDDGEESNEITIVGEVEILDNGLIVIGGWIIAPSSTFDPSILTVGDLVILTAIQLNDTTVQTITFAILIFVHNDCTLDTNGSGSIDDEDCPDEEGEENQDDCPEVSDSDDEDCPADEYDYEPQDHRGVCTNLNPVGQSLAVQFEVDEETILEWRCQGFGYGEITRALSYADDLELDVEDILDMRRDGMGWGNIRKQLNADEGAITIRNGHGNNGHGNGNGNGNGHGNGKDNKKNKNKNKNKKK